MKYMGSKRWMLRNGLGHLITERANYADRFVDLFTGSGAVAQFAATRAAIRVAAFDLQHFCAALADGIVGRDSPLESPGAVWTSWFRRAEGYLTSHGNLPAANDDLPAYPKFTRVFVGLVRTRCARETTFPITKAYGGHYFSRSQALWLDALRATLPTATDERRVALAALIDAASQCTASPGHTAQPFQPTKGAKQYLYDAWTRNVATHTHAALVRYASAHARVRGTATVRDANEAANELRAGDLVFIDPPYSGVHYSRFYHVLETITRGGCDMVDGVGRYPPRAQRPRSSYSMRSQSRSALGDLLCKVGQSGASALLTFPLHDCSNGLSGETVAAEAQKLFKVRRKLVENRFSTLGGTQSDIDAGNGRTARQVAHEIIFILEPK